MKTNFMKTFLIALLPICAVSCIDNVPEEEALPRDAVSFEYYIDQHAEPKYYLDFYVDTDVTFVNTSPTEGDVTWDFGEYAVINEDKCQGTDVMSCYFTKAGTHKVTLTIVDADNKRKVNVQTIMIAPIKPIVKVKYTDDVCEVANTLVTFDVELPNPKNKPATFSWTFPTDTEDAEGEKYETFVGKDIKDLPAPVKFSHVGSQQVQLNVELGEDNLEPTVLNVQVAYNEAVPTLYYAVQGGRIMALKLVNKTPEELDGMKIYPFDLGVSSGQHPFNILFKDSLLYVLDAGKQFYYVNDVNGVLGDGKISVVAKDGSKVQTMISNAGQAAFDDPFYGCIDGDFLYYANRNTGVIKVPLDDRDKVYNTTEYPYHFYHNTLGYYQFGIAYGAIGGMVDKIDGVWHWTKYYNGYGIFRFTDDDILKTAISAGDKSKLPKAGVLLDGMSPKSFVYAAKSTKPKMLVHLMDDGINGLYAATYEEMEAVGSNSSALATYAVKYNGQMFEINKTGNLPAVDGPKDSEWVGVTQLTYDEVNDCVYFAYRNNSLAGETKYPPTGIYGYYVAADSVACIVEGVSAYGVAVNNNPAKLF